MKIKATTPVRLNFAKMFLFLAMVKVIDFYGVEVCSVYYNGLPDVVHTELLQEDDFFQGNRVESIDFHTWDSPVTKVVQPLPFYSEIFSQTNGYGFYTQKFPKQKIRAGFVVSASLHALKFNISHLNLDEEEPSGFHPEVV